MGGIVMCDFDSDLINVRFILPCARLCVFDCVVNCKFFYEYSNGSRYMAAAKQPINETLVRWDMKQGSRLCMPHCAFVIVFAWQTRDSKPSCTQWNSNTVSCACCTLCILCMLSFVNRARPYCGGRNFCKGTTKICCTPHHEAKGWKRTCVCYIFQTIYPSAQLSYKENARFLHVARISDFIKNTVSWQRASVQCVHLWVECT